MYGHPKLVKQWAKIMKPDATPAQVERARQMRLAKASKAAFMRAQGDLFSRDGSAGTASQSSVAENPRRPVGGITRKEKPC